MWVIMLMANQYTLACPSHAMLLVVLFQPFQPCDNRRIFFWLCFFGAKGIVRKRVEANRLWLVRVKVLR